ncbi:MAG: sensor histidine kinase [Micrococcales bacterium]
MNKFAKFLNGYLPGRLAANPWVLLGLTPFIIFFGLEAYYPKANDDIAYVITIIVIAHLVTSLTALLLNYLVIRFFMIRSIHLLLLIYLLAGVVDSLVLNAGLAIPWIPPGTGLSAWSLLTISSVVTSSWLLMGHLALGLLIGNVRAFNQLQAWNSELQNLHNNAQAELSSYKDSLRGAIVERIERVLDQIAAQLRNLTGATNPELLLSTAAKVRDLTENDVRQLSHELSDVTDDKFNKSAKRQKFSWHLFAKFGGDASANIPWVLSVGTLQAVSLALAIGSFETTLVVVIALAVGFPILVIADKWRIKLTRNSPLWLQILSAPVEYLVLATIGVQVVKLVAKDFGDLYLHVDTFMVAVPVGGISIWLLIFLIRGFSATYEIRTRELSLLAAEMLDSLVEVRTQLALLRRKLVKILHGSVQGRLASVSLALTATASTKSHDEANSLIEKAREQLDLARTDLTQAFADNESQVDFDAQLETLVEGWRGLVEINFDFPEEVKNFLQNDLELATKVVEAIQECLTNAVRHESATEVQIRFELQETALQMTCINQASNDASKITPGLGWQQMLDGADNIQVNNSAGLFEISLTWRL